MKNELDFFINKFDEEFSSIKKLATKYLDEDSKIDEYGNAIIYRRPWVAPQNYGIKIFAPANINYFKIFEEKYDQQIPILYQNFLLKMNGCFIFDFDLFGLPNSLYNDGLLNRKTLQSFDLGTANANWKYGYKINSDLFHFGGRAYTFEENLGYFLDNKNNIHSFLKDGSLLNSWNNFSDFLEDEIRLAEKMMIEEKNVNII